jgi:glycosyltransferase involved in cell wall biosynthesis
MNIIFLSTSDSGGAGKAAYSVYSSLKRYHECQFIVFRKETSRKDIYEMNAVKKTSYWLYWFFEKIKDKLFQKRYVLDTKYDLLNLLEPAPYIKIRELDSLIGMKPDLFILNWVSSFINSQDIKNIFKKYKTPLIWLLHDYAPFTGGCHIAWDCKGFTGTCGNCPGLNSKSVKDKTNKILRNKLKNLHNVPVYTTGWSEFILSKSKQSSLFKERTLIRVCPGIDSELFSPPQSKNLCKLNLNIPVNSKVIMFGAQNILSEYKGLTHLLSAMGIINKYLLPGIKFILLTFGKEDAKLPGLINFPWISLGKTENPELLYQAADVFVAPTLQDTGPMTVCESLMCGTPVVGYPMGMIPDLIKDEETGYIVETGNIGLLAQKIARILNLQDTEYLDLSSRCRNKALEKCSINAQLESFSKLFDLLQLKFPSLIDR